MLADGNLDRDLARNWRSACRIRCCPTPRWSRPISASA